MFHFLEIPHLNMTTPVPIRILCFAAEGEMELQFSRGIQYNC